MYTFYVVFISHHVSFVVFIFVFLCVFLMMALLMLPFIWESVPLQFS